MTQVDWYKIVYIRYARSYNFSDFVTSDYVFLNKEDYVFLNEENAFISQF